MTRVLIVHSEPRTAKYLREELSEHGFAIDDYLNGARALDLLPYDIVIVDAALPGAGPWQLAEDMLRRKGTLVVRRLAPGMAEYCVSAFEFGELAADLCSALRKGSNAEAQTVRVADLELDLEEEQARRAGKPLHLTPGEFALLALLARRRGEVLSRAMITEQVWDVAFDCDRNAVEVAVRRLRSKVDDPFAEKLIHSVRGAGYVLEERLPLR